MPVIGKHTPSVSQSHPYSQSSHVSVPPSPALLQQACLQLFCYFVSGILSVIYSINLPPVGIWNGNVSKRCCWKLKEVSLFMDLSLPTISCPSSSTTIAHPHHVHVMITVQTKSVKEDGQTREKARYLCGFFHELERNRFQMLHKAKVLLRKSVSNWKRSKLPNHHLGFHGDSALCGWKWRTSIPLHSDCPVKHTLVEVLFRFWLLVSIWGLRSKG